MTSEQGSVATPLLLSLLGFLVALFMAMAVAVPAFAAQQAQSVSDEMQQTAYFVAAFARNNLAGSQVQESYLQDVANVGAGMLLNRPLNGSTFGDQSGAVGEAYVTSVTLNSVQLLAPGDPVPDGGGTARAQGAAITFTMQVSMLGGLVNEPETRTVWAFPGSL